MTGNPFTDWTKNFGDYNDMIRYMRKNAEMFTALAQIGTETTQELGRRGFEVAKTNAEHALKASKEAANRSTPENAAAKHAEYFKDSLDRNVNAMREMAEMSTKAAQEAFDLVNKRVAEQMKELSEAAGSMHHTAKKKAA